MQSIEFAVRQFGHFLRHRAAASEAKYRKLPRLVDAQDSTAELLLPEKPGSSEGAESTPSPSIPRPVFIGFNRLPSSIHADKLEPER